MSSPRLGARGAPVMVWIYGGGNVAGKNSISAYDGSAFARDGVILVSINYSLGALGFFAHPALTKAAAPGEALGDYALMDQIAALKWVQRNIKAFGGDPGRVTVFGESAGGIDITVPDDHPLSPRTVRAGDRGIGRGLGQAGHPGRCGGGRRGAGGQGGRPQRHAGAASRPLPPRR